MPRIAHLLMLVWCTALVGRSVADVLRVPEQYPTIQGAIDAAVDGDEVELEANTVFEESINFRGKAVHLRPELPYNPENLTVVLVYNDVGTPDLAFEIVSGEGRSTIIEGVIIRMPFTGSSPFGRFEIIDSSPTFRNVAFADGGGHIIPETRIIRSDVMLENCRPNRGLRFWIGVQLYDSTLTFDGGRIGGGWYLFDDAEHPSTVRFLGTRITNKGQEGTLISSIPRHPGGPIEGVTLPDLTFENCQLAQGYAPMLIEGILGPGADLRCTDLGPEDPAQDNTIGLVLDVTADGGNIELARCDSLFHYDYHGGQGTITLEHGATLTIVDSVFAGIDATSDYPTLIHAIDGSVFIERSQLLSRSDNSPAVDRLIEGAGDYLVLRDVALPAVGPSTDVVPALIDFAPGSAILEGLTLPPFDPDNDRVAVPLVHLTTAGGPVFIAETHLPKLVTADCDLVLQNVTVGSGSHTGGSMRMTAGAGPLGGVYTVHDTDAQLLGAASTDAGFEFYDSTVHIADARFDRGETAVFAERCSLTVDRTLFHDVNRASTNPDTGGVLIVYDTDLTVADCAITSCAAGDQGDYPSTNLPAIFSAHGASTVAIVGCDVHDAWANNRGVIHTRDDATVRAVNLTLTGSACYDGPLVANARGSSRIELIQCAIVGNDTEQDGQPGRLAYAGPRASIGFNQCTLWGNVVANDPFFGDVTLTNSLLEGATPFDPAFARLPSDGGDGWYNSRSLTPDLDESANNDYGDLRLRPGSPAIDAGDTGALPPDAFDLDADADTAEPLPLDLAGNPRAVDDPATPDAGPVSPPVDMGAYEFQPAPCPADLDRNGVLNFDDLDAFVAAFLTNDPLADLDASGTVNFDDLDAFIASYLAGCP